MRLPTNSIHSQACSAVRMLRGISSVHTAASWRVFTAAETAMLHDPVRSFSYDKRQKADEANLVRSSTVEAGTANQQNARPVAPRSSSGSSRSSRQTRPLRDALPTHAPAQQAEQHPEPQISPAEPFQGVVGGLLQRGSQPSSLPRSHISKPGGEITGASRHGGAISREVSPERTELHKQPLTPPPSNSSSGGSTDGDTDSDRNKQTDGLWKLYASLGSSGDKTSGAFIRSQHPPQQAVFIKDGPLTWRWMRKRGKGSIKLSKRMRRGGKLYKRRGVEARGLA